jgi:hypothetical protein
VLSNCTKRDGAPVSIGIGLAADDFAFGHQLLKIDLACYWIARNARSTSATMAGHFRRVDRAQAHGDISASDGIAINHAMAITGESVVYSYRGWLGCRPDRRFSKVIRSQRR